MSDGAMTPVKKKDSVEHLIPCTVGKKNVLHALFKTMGNDKNNFWISF